MKEAVDKTQAAKGERISPKATYQDVLDAPPHVIAQIIDGRLYTFPRPPFPHNVAGSGLGGFLNQTFQYGRGGPGGWWILNKLECHLDDNILVPGIGGWRRERMPNFLDAAYWTLAPDWACEVLSPSTRDFDTNEKSKAYAEAGVGFYWLVDPEALSLEAYELRRGEWMLIDRLYGDAEVSLPPFDAVSFSLGDLWLPSAVHKGAPMTEPALASVRISG